MERLPRHAFQKDRLLRDGTYVVAFLADWCPFCARFASVFEAWDPGPSLRTAVADVTDDGSPLWEDFQIEVVPALVVFHDGRPVFRQQSTLGMGLPENALDRAQVAAQAANR